MEFRRTIHSSFSIRDTPAGRRLHVAGPLPDGFHGEPTADGRLCPMDAQNARAIRRELPWTAPQRVGLRRSFGFGDRLGVATPGHLAAVKGSGVFPVLAQQSIREMERARRTPQQVLDDVTWAVLETGYDTGFGCDADHVKSEREIDGCIEAGFIAFTIDPGEFVDDEADTADRSALEGKMAALPWDALNDDPNAHRRTYESRYGFEPEEYARAAVKYGKAVARVAQLDAHIASRLGRGSYDLEVSVDETETPTTPAQHRFIALELQRLGVDFVGLAPRLVGEFYKGVDYVGDLSAFEAHYRAHADVARELGPYKLSLHSGSDKLSIYPVIIRHTPEYVHLKTAGTSWLEALRVVAAFDPVLFRGILELATQGYAENRRSYYLDGAVERIPSVSDDRLSDLLNHHDARQVLHVAFGPALETYREAIFAVLDARREEYRDGLRRHFERHLAPFRAVTS